MAKKKVDDKEVTIEDFGERLKNEITKEYGKGVFIGGNDVINRSLKVIPWCPSLDMICAGVSEGTWISMVGAPKLGKTNVLLKLAANCQKAGKRVFFLSPEGRLKRKDLVNVEGLDPSEDKFTVIESYMNELTGACKILSTQDYLSIAEKILKTFPGCFLIIDSVSALADEKELHGDVDLQTRGRNYQIISRFVNNLGQYVSASKSITAGIIHKIANTSGFGSPTSERACNRWKYQADYRLEVTHVDKWKNGEEIIGHKMHFKCHSSALTTPYKQCVSSLRFGVGLDDLYEIFEYGCACGLIDKGGAWYTLTFIKSHPELGIEDEVKLQGGENVWSYLKENPKVADCLKQEVSRFSSDLVKCGDDE